ncbi:MAG: polymer-forming cytoskeletal protein [Rhizomicrobium sp.]|jgi:cytoskeletal protein CcmA (bactofilin family)
MFSLAHRVDTRTAPAREALPVSILERAFVVHGVLDCEGEVRIHGRIFGRVNADRLVLASDGCVEGDIVANEVHIAGRLIGRVFAPTVSIDESADITGRIFHTNLTAARGHKLEGRMPWRPLSYFETLDQLPEPTL